MFLVGDIVRFKRNVLTASMKTFLYTRNTSPHLPQVVVGYMVRYNLPQDFHYIPNPVAGGAAIWAKNIPSVVQLHSGVSCHIDSLVRISNIKEGGHPLEMVIAFAPRAEYEVDDIVKYEGQEYYVSGYRLPKIFRNMHYGNDMVYSIQYEHNTISTADQGIPPYVYLLRSANGAEKSVKAESLSLVKRGGCWYRLHPKAAKKHKPTMIGAAQTAFAFNEYTDTVLMDNPIDMAYEPKPYEFVSYNVVDHKYILHTFNDTSIAIDRNKKGRMSKKWITMLNMRLPQWHERVIL